MHDVAPDAAPAFEILEQLVTSTDIRDRAFAASALSLCHQPEDRGRVAALYERVRETARTQHAVVRDRIRDRTLDGPAFLADLGRAPLELRDHLVEEILGIAYPPLELAPLPPDAVHYCPSGLAEILFTLEHGDLGAGATFVDLGSGLGKVVLLVALLTGARAFGVEIDPELVSHARAAARALDLGNAHFALADMREAALPPADVYYMYSPVVRGAAAIVARLEPVARERRIRVFSQALDLTELPWLRPGKAESYWLQMYEGPDGPARRT